ncbi:MAG: hypothetical protein COT43_09215 [Candidatus Marinimicrobia bacterium CG08_land_8_20_14_0_20_45_22]|nr:MAG: hypothetical protein COT43_09215 [Candidatus Marinimicrobia bacterium CG08_land_8_20_14_0_20_45_22]
MNFRATLIFFTISIIAFAKPKPDTTSSDVTVKTVLAVRKDAEPITIDGRMTESAWSLAPEGKAFIQRDPDEGKSSTERTTFKVLYDDRNLYICVVAYDSEPSKIRGMLTRRDTDSPSDWIGISIDSYNDNRTAFEFGINAAGVKYDVMRFDDESQDFNWDAIWDGASNIDSAGWIAEFRIPFKELRFSDDNNDGWGINFMRIISRKNEETYWVSIPKNESGWVSHYGRLTGISSIPKQKRIYIAPYLTAGSTTSQDLVTEIHSEKYDRASNIGADIKYGLTNNLTLDMTINPDFGQIEADPGEFNLTAFESYLPEKRPFFTEGNNIFSSKLGFGDGDESLTSLFYSRRVGRAPHRVLADEDDNDTTWTEDPKMTSILGAAKVTGKTINGWSIGLINAITDKEVGKFIYQSGRTEWETIEPLTNYSILRFQKDFRNGQTTIGGMATATLRKIDNPNLEFLHDRALTSGIDFSHQFLNHRYMIEGTFSASNIHGRPEAILQTQLSPRRYFQRLDARHVRIDSSRTSLTGTAYKFTLEKTGGKHWQWATGVLSYSPEFEINDVGYIRQVDQTLEFEWIGYSERTPGKWYRNYNFNISQWNIWDYEPKYLGWGSSTNFSIEFLNYWEAWCGVQNNSRGISNDALRGGPSFLVPGRTNFWLGVNSDSRKKIFGELKFSGWSTTDQSVGMTISPELVFRLTTNLKATLNPTFQSEYDSWRWVDNVEDATGNRHYIFAEMHQKTFSCIVRLDFTLTPNLSVQFYGEPFLTAGNYQNFTEAAYPRMGHFQDQFRDFSSNEVTYFPNDKQFGVDNDSDGSYEYRFSKPDFHYKQFRCNLVIRWEYLPGSLLYLVWSNGLTNANGTGTFDLRHDIRELFSTSPENVLIVKLSYLLNR